MGNFLYKINAFEATRQVFSLATGLNNAINFNVKPIDVDEDQILVFEDPTIIGVSVFDTPIFETLAIKHPRTGEMIYFEDAPLIEIQGRQNVVKSDVNKRKGSVKEYINLDDYKIGVKGLLVNHTGESLPHEKIRALDEILKAGVALEVTSQILNAIGIYNLVIEDFNFIPNDSWTNVMPYKFRALSDDPIELDLDSPVIKDTASFQTILPG